MASQGLPPNPAVRPLDVDGAIVFRVTPSSKRHLSKIWNELEQLEELDPDFAGKMGRYMRQGDTDPSDLEGRPYLGSFGALNWPSSYRVGYSVRKKAVFLAQDHIPIPEGYQVNLLPDRVVFRPKGARINRETPHRDLPDLRLFTKLNKKFRKGELREVGRIYQGWVNLGPGDTTLTYLPGSHNDHLSSGRYGFSQEDHTRNFPAGDFTTVCIPPGQAVLFDPRIVHKVASGTVQMAFTRVHFGVRVAKDGDPLYLDQADLATQGMPPRLPSGQLVGIITPNFRSVHKATRDRWLQVNKPLLKQGYRFAKGGFVEKCVNEQ